MLQSFDQPLSVFKKVAAITLMSVSGVSFADVSPWELEAHDEDKDIKVFTRSVGDSPLKEFKGVTQIKAPVSAFVAVLKDADVATDWMHNVIEFDVMESPNETESVIYTVNKTPWPVTDRDAYVRSVMTANADGSVVSAISAAPEYKENNEDYIRMPKIAGAWTFAPKADGITEVTYQVHANPGGSLPTWLVNAIVVETPMNTLSNLQELVVAEKYQGQSFVFMQQATTENTTAQTELAQ